jgi:hexokinase
MIAGYYLGEVFRLVILDLHSQGAIFEDKDLSTFQKPYSIDTSTLAEIESDPYENLTETGEMFLSKFKLECTEPELRLIRRLAELIGLRAARLSACGVAAICTKKNIEAYSITSILILGVLSWGRWVGIYKIPIIPRANGASSY